MGKFITVLIFGLFVCTVGAVNMTGNISTIHRYHRHRVLEHNKLPFGKQVGLGTIICGAGCIFASFMLLLDHLLSVPALVFVGWAVIALCAIIGIIVIYRAVKKYNGGIF